MDKFSCYNDPLIVFSFILISADNDRLDFSMMPFCIVSVFIN